MVTSLYAHEQSQFQKHNKWYPIKSCLQQVTLLRLCYAHFYFENNKLDFQDQVMLL